MILSIRRLTMVSLILLLIGPAFAQSADQLYSGGRQAFTDGLWSTSASQFSRLLREYPEDRRADSAAYMAAVAYYEAAEYSRCIDVLSKFPRNYPDSAWNQRVAYWEGLSQFELKNWRNAAAAFERQAAVSDEQAYKERSLMYLGTCLESLEDWASAREAYQELLNGRADYEVAARAIFRLGQISLTTSEPEEALEAFYRLAYDYSGSELATDVDYWIGESQRRSGRNEDALSSYRNFLATVYESPYRHYALLEAARLASAGGDDDEALAYLDLRDSEGARGSDEDSGTALRIRAVSYLRTGRIIEARSAYRRILDKPKDESEAQIAAFGVAQTWLGTEGVSNAVPYLEQASEGPDSRIASDSSFSAGQILLLDGDMRGAGVLEGFAERYTRDSRREEALRMAVKARRDSGSVGEAMASLTTLIIDYPESPNSFSYLFLRAEILLDTGDSSMALKDYGLIADSDASSTMKIDALSRIGFIYAGRGEHVRAAEYYLEASRVAGGVRGGDEGRRAVYSAGVAFLNAGNTDRAIEMFSRLLTADPSAAWGTEAAYHRGEAYYDSGKYSEARESYQMAMEYGDDQWAFESAYALAWTWFRESDWEAAAESFQRSADMALNPEQKALSLFRVGLSLASTGAWEESLEYYLTALESQGGPWREEALYQQSWALLKMGRIEEAESSARILAEENPASTLPADLPFRMGEDAMAAGNYQEAISWYDRCTAAYPNSSTGSRAELRAALAAGESGNAAEAARRYEGWITANPSDSGKSSAARSWAQSVRASGDPGLAKSALESASALDSGDGSVVTPMILTWARLSGIPAESASDLERIAENETLPAADRAEALLLRAHRYRLDLKYGRSRQVYEVLIRDIPGRIGAEAQEGLARSYADEGKNDEAAEAYLAVPYLFPEEKDLIARSLREAERLYREAGREDEADKIRERIAAE